MGIGQLPLTSSTSENSMISELGFEHRDDIMMDDRRFMGLYFVFDRPRDFCADDDMVVRWRSLLSPRLNILGA